MGLMSFIKDAGEKLFNRSEAEAATTDPATAADANQAAANAILGYIEAQNLGLSNLSVAFDALSGQVTLTGDAPSKEASEKAALSAGNVDGVDSVTNNLNVADDTPDAQYHDVVSGDNLSAIARKYYGDANKYHVIFEANKPMLEDPDEIYPGQKLRIPPLAE